MTMLKKLSLFVVLASLLAPAMAAEVNVYSARKEILIKPLLDQFSEQTGIKVRLLTGKADALLKRLEVEGRKSPADLFITTDAGRLHRAKTLQLLQPVSSELLKSTVPEQMRDRDDTWYGLSVRSRPIIYATDRVKPGELSTYEGLVDAKWKGRVCVRSSSNIYNQSLVASMIEVKGEQATTEWARGLVANFARPPAGGDTDQLMAVAAGLCDVALANTYYLGIMTGGKDQKKRDAADKLAVFWPNQDDRGAHVNVSGAGVTAHAGNRDAAIKLLEFLVGEEAQAWYARVNYEYPVDPSVDVSNLLKSWGDFKADSINLTVLGDNNPRAVKVMDRAGWR
jgi:iron(III) transport system substrate-binding protein